ncbi:MAG: efflux RND transporter permease subunit, partial [Thalassolituus sp.]
MKIAELSIRRPVLATVMNLVLILVGVIAYQTLPVREYPNIDVPAKEKGLIISQVVEGGSSDGILVVGDILTHFAGRRMFYNADLKDCLLGYKAGESV